MQSTLFSALFLLPSVLASPTLPLALQPRQTTPDPNVVTLEVRDFRAFMADPYVEGAQSNLTFHVTDFRWTHYQEVDCVIPNTYFHLYAISALFDWCGDRKSDISYRYDANGLTLRRGWWDNETSYVTGSSTQNTNWMEGPGGNVTQYPDGKLYARNGPGWFFPITRISAGTPPT